MTTHTDAHQSNKHHLQQNSPKWLTQKWRSTKWIKTSEEILRMKKGDQINLKKKKKKQGEGMETINREEEKFLIAIFS